MRDAHVTGVQTCALPISKRSVIGSNRPDRPFAGRAKAAPSPWWLRCLVRYAQPSTDYMSVFGLPLRQPLAVPECPPHTLVNYEVCFRRLDRFAYPRHTRLVD